MYEFQTKSQSLMNNASFVVTIKLSLSSFEPCCSPPGSRFLSVKQALHTAVPERLLSRDSERTAIRTFLEQRLLQNKPGSLYISGAPGTGKTACLNCVLQEMKVSDRVMSQIKVVERCHRDSIVM